MTADRAIDVEVSTTNRPDVYHLGVRATEGYAASHDTYEFEFYGSLADLEKFAHDLLMQLRDFQPLT